MFGLTALGETEPTSATIVPTDPTSAIIVSIDPTSAIIGAIIGILAIMVTFLVLKQKIAMGGLAKFLLETRLVTKGVAALILLVTLNTLAALVVDPVIIVAIIAGIAGSAATFLFSTKGSGD